MSTDPTAIPIEFDPREQRMSGVAYHGDTTFDVPFISHIIGNLWTGGCTDGLVLPTEIEHVISLYPWEHYSVQHELKSFTYVRMYDSIDAAMDQVDGIARWVNSCRFDGPTLVHCQAGLNRSGLVAARSLMFDIFSADRAIGLLREKRSPAVLCNPAFEEWLRSR